MLLHPEDMEELRDADLYLNLPDSHLRLSFKNPISQAAGPPSHRPDTKDGQERNFIMKLEVTNLTRTFKDTTAVDHISCTLGNGVYGLLGVNGAGKTTLMRMLCTLLLPTSGSIRWEGTDIFSMGGEYRKLLGYLPQDFGCYPDFTIQDYLLYIASIKGLRPAHARKRAELLLHQMGLWDVRKRKMKRLSGGMKRRAGIAQAMLNDPGILILDEPTAGLDPGERIRFRNLISEIADRRLVLLSTHIVQDIESIAGEILLMKDGKLMLTGTAQELTASMPEQVWRCTIPRERLAHCLQHYQVSNIRNTPDGAELRILSLSCPAEGAVPEPASLEDVFLYHFGEKAGADHDSV